MALYEIAILGSPTAEQIAAIQTAFQRVAGQFKLRIGDDIALEVKPPEFRPSQRVCAAAVFFGAPGAASFDITNVIDMQAVPVLPVASAPSAVTTEIPLALQSLNCIFTDSSTIDRIFSAALECIGLLPRQRRVFLSYKRNEATAAAVQLFAELSARQFDVFLDTHAIGAGVEFQEALWHQLCDVDVLLMLETPGYFKSRWTSAEYGRALSKCIGVVRVQWPDSTPSIHTGTASRVELLPEELKEDGCLAEGALIRIGEQLEAMRSLSQATRQLSLINAVQSAVEQVEGKMIGVGAKRAMLLKLRSGRDVLVQPTIGVPTSLTLQDTRERAGKIDSAVVYDHFGMAKSHQSHLDWLAQNVPGTRWMKRTDAAWDIGGWEAK